MTATRSPRMCAVSPTLARQAAPKGFRVVGLVSGAVVMVGPLQPRSRRIHSLPLDLTQWVRGFTPCGRK